ncbi:PIG-L deacetylase family protein [Georgenia faecalis]|uniref:PIG-L deacetylase family protein n=1 Tax=Georgenia faecalis TaxID=2483799 RepID=A0ABV9D9Y4_9MICO|nr:PIG-L deacetylase family protein [Georgenia faecalis]
MRVLVLSPHPDDDVIGCGGTLRQLVLGGAQVDVVYVTSGENGGLGRPPEEIATTRETEARQAAEVMGYASVRFLRRPEGGLEQDTTLVPALIGLVRELRPALALLPHARDGHVDHVATHRAGVRAVAAAAGPWYSGVGGDPHAVPVVLGYEVWTPIEAPALVRDVTDAHETQVRALELHASQVADFAYEQFIAGLNSYRGALLGRGRMAEAFDVLQLPGGLDLGALVGG